MLILLLKILQIQTIYKCSTSSIAINAVVSIVSMPSLHYVFATKSDQESKYGNLAMCIFLLLLYVLLCIFVRE